MPAHRQFLVVTVPVRVGFPQFEDIMSKWSAAAGNGWMYGNVYDETDNPLNWW